MGSPAAQFLGLDSRALPATDGRKCARQEDEVEAQSNNAGCLAKSRIGPRIWSRLLR